MLRLCASLACNPSELLENEDGNGNKIKSRCEKDQETN